MGRPGAVRRQFRPPACPVPTRRGRGYADRPSRARLMSETLRARQVLTPSQLNALARDLLEGQFAQVWVEGEISGFSRPASGHCYFTLKDGKAQVRCALFRANAARLR